MSESNVKLLIMLAGVSLIIGLNIVAAVMHVSLGIAAVGDASATVIAIAATLGVKKAVVDEANALPPTPGS